MFSQKWLYYSDVCLYLDGFIGEFMSYSQKWLLYGTFVYNKDKSGYVTAKFELKGWTIEIPVYNIGKNVYNEISIQKIASIQYESPFFVCDHLFVSDHLFVCDNLICWHIPFRHLD